MAGMLRKARIKNSFDSLVTLKPLGKLLRIARMALHAEVQSFKAPQGKE